MGLYIYAHVLTYACNKYHIDQYTCVISINSTSLILDNTGKVRWYNTGVILYSPSSPQCIEVVEQLTSEKHNYWIRIDSANPESALLILSQIHQTGLHRLIIYKSPLVDTCIYCITQSIFNNQLQELDLTNTSLSSVHLVALSQAISNNKSLVTLYINNEKIGENISFFGEMLIANKTLQRLTLFKCKITANGVQEFSESLMCNNTLTELDLTGNLLTADSIHYLLEVLTTNNSIKKLEIDREHKNFCQQFNKFTEIEDRLKFY